MKPFAPWAIAALLIASSAAASETATVTFTQDPSRIANLQLPTKAVPVVEDFVEGKSQLFAEVDGTFNRPYWSLLLGKTVIPLDSNGNFTAKVRLTARENLAVFYGVGPLGEIERQTMLVTTDLFDVSRDTEHFGAAVTLPQVNFGIGVTTLAYTESGLDGNFNPYSIDYSMVALTGKAGVTKRFENSNWILGATGFLNLVPLTKSATPTARFLGLNFRVGYTFPKIRDPWRLTLYGGFYYTTMLVSDNSFGFKDVSGPQLYPVLTRALPGKVTISGYLKYSPISNRFALLPTGSHEIAGGLIYSYPLSNGHPFAYTLDISSLDLTTTDTVQINTTTSRDINTVFHSTTISLGVSYGL